MEAATSSALEPRSASNDIPGPRGLELYRAILHLKDHPVEFLLEVALRYGPVVSMPFIRDPVVLISGPQDIQYLLHQNYRNYQKTTERWKVFRELIGNGLLASDGDLWRRQRQRIQPAFHQERLAMFEDLLQTATTDVIAEWRKAAAEEKPIGIFGELLRLSLRIITKAMFGRDVREFEKTALRAFASAHVYINPMSLINLLELPVAVRRLFLPRFRQFETAFRQLNGIVDQMIAERRASGEDNGDFLSMLLMGRDDEHGETMDQAQLRDEVMGAFLAGHETTAIALTWAFYLLSKNPVARRQLQAEVGSVLGGRFPRIQDLPNLKYNRMVIDESMRLYPPAWGFDRKSVADDVLGGYRIPAGSTVAICTYVMHHHPAYWENPEGFDPMRFSEERSVGRPEYAYLPFGGGPRRCIGNRFAMLEMQLILAAITQNFDLDLVPGPAVNVWPTVNLQPDRNFEMALKDLAPR
jgi:cytochrome P450